MFFGDSLLSTWLLGSLQQNDSFAIGGESAKWVASRLPYDVTLPRARAVELGAGTNDLLEDQTSEKFRSAWPELRSQVPASAHVIYLRLPQPADSAAHPGDYEAAGRLFDEFGRRQGRVLVALAPTIGECRSDKSALVADGTQLDVTNSRQLLQ